MAAVVDVTILKASDSKQFQFRAVAPFSNSKLQPAIGIPLVNQTAANNILFRFQGQTEPTTFTFALFDDGTDVSNGTEGGGVTTVAEQITYLRDTIFAATFDESWTLTQSRYYSGGVTGVITALRFDQNQGAGTVVTGSFQFQRGRTGAL